MSESYIREHFCKTDEASFVTCTQSSSDELDEVLARGIIWGIFCGDKYFSKSTFIWNGPPNGSSSKVILQKNYIVNLRKKISNYNKTNPFSGSFDGSAISVGRRTVFSVSSCDLISRSDDCAIGKTTGFISVSVVDVISLLVIDVITLGWLIVVVVLSVDR